MTTRAELIADAIVNGRLKHPGDGQNPEQPVFLPGFRNTGMSDEQNAEYLGAAADLIGEAIDHLLTTNGHPDIAADELQTLRTAAADAPSGARTITLYDRADPQLQNPRLRLTIGKTDHIQVDIAAIARALTTSQE